MHIYHAKELPYNDLEMVGITKTDFLNLPPEVLDKLLTGRLSPLMKLSIDITELGLQGKELDLSDKKLKEKLPFWILSTNPERNSLLLLAKIAFEMKENKPTLKIYPIKKIMDEKILLTSDEKEILLNGGVLTKKVNKSDKRKSFVQLDRETNTLVSTFTNNVYIPLFIGGQNLSKEQTAKLKQGETVEVKLKDKTVTLEINLNERAGIKMFEGNYHQWKMQKLIEWDRLNPGVTGYWLTSENGWQYKNMTERQSQNFKIKY